MQEPNLFQKAGISDQLNIINQELTQEAKKDPRYVNFMKWLKDNGARFPRVDYPVAFGKGGLIGAAATEDIKHWEAFLFIPGKLIISETSVRHSQIGQVIETHNEIFKDHYDGEYLTLIAFLMYELNKGESSFWHPYFQATNPSDLISFWNIEELKELQDEALITHALVYKQEIEEEWSLISKIFLIYPEIFPTDKFNKQLFMKAYSMVVSRCFGWSLPCTMMIPFADCLNHFTTDTQYQVYHKNLHRVQASISSQGYSTKNKYKVDYRDLYETDEEWAQIKKENQKMCLAGGDRRKKRPTFQELKPKYEALVNKRTGDVWQVGYENSTDEEDNDTSDEEESDDEDDEEGKDKGQKLLDREISRAKESKLSTNEQEQKLRYDMIDKLIEKKASEFEKEEMRKMDKDQESEEEEEDGEDFTWWKYDDPDMYFSMTTKSKSYFGKGKQVFNCYGRRTNRFLLLNYGFTLQNNKYNSVAFKVQIDLNPKNPPARITDVLYSPKQELKNEKDEEETKFDSKGKAVAPSTAASSDIADSLKKGPDPAVQFTKQIRLKKSYMSQQLFAYLRANLFGKYEGKNIQKIMISTPVDLDYEILVHKCAIELLTALYKSRFTTSLNDDINQLKEGNNSDRLTLALMYRVASKEIVNQNIIYSQIMMQILLRIKQGVPFREAYSGWVNEFEDKEDVYKNRLLMRQYLREFAQNRYKLLGIPLP